MASRELQARLERCGVRHPVAVRVVVVSCRIVSYHRITPPRLGIRYNYNVHLLGLILAVPCYLHTLQYYIPKYIVRSPQHMAWRGLGPSPLGWVSDSSPYPPEGFWSPGLTGTFSGFLIMDRSSERRGRDQKKKEEEKSGCFACQVM